MSFFSDITGATAAKAQKQGGKAAVKAGNTQAKYDYQGILQLAPYSKSGKGANKLLSDALGINGPEAQAAYYSNFQNDPGYIATRDAGIAGIDQDRAAGGALHSGGTLKALQDFGMRLMQSQFMDRLRNLSGQEQLGLGATNNIATLLGSMGQAKAGGIMGQAAGNIGAANARSAGSMGLLNAGIGLLGGALRGGGGFLTSISPR